MSNEDRERYREDFKRRTSLPDPFRNPPVTPPRSTPPPRKRLSWLGWLLRVVLLSAMFSLENAVKFTWVSANLLMAWPLLVQPKHDDIGNVVSAS